MENWDDYRLILAVQGSTSLRAAAKSLGVNHATISRRINNLNKSHPQKVYFHTPDGPVLTDYGAILFETSKTISELMRNQQTIVSEFQQDKTETISLSLPSAILQYLLLDDLAVFQKQENIKLKITSSYDFADLHKDEADLVIRVSNNPGDDLVGHRVGSIKVGYFAGKGYLKNTNDSDLGWITGDDTSWVTNSPYPDSPVLFQVEDLVARHIMADRNMGMIRGAAYIAKQHKNLMLLSDQLFAFQDVWVLTHHDRRNSRGLKKLMNFLLNRLRALL